MSQKAGRSKTLRARQANKTTCRTGVEGKQDWEGTQMGNNKNLKKTTQLNLTGPGHTVHCTIVK